MQLFFGLKGLGSVALALLTLCLDVKENFILTQCLPPHLYRQVFLCPLLPLEASSGMMPGMGRTQPPDLCPGRAGRAGVYSLLLIL